MLIDIKMPKPDEYHAQLSWAWKKKFYYLEAW